MHSTHGPPAPRNRRAPLLPFVHHTQNAQRARHALTRSSATAASSSALRSSALAVAARACSSCSLSPAASPLSCFEACPSSPILESTSCSRSSNSCLSRCASAACASRASRSACVGSAGEGIGHSFKNLCGMFHLRPAPGRLRAPPERAAGQGFRAFFQPFHLCGYCFFLLWTFLKRIRAWQSPPAPLQLCHFPKAPH